SPRLMVPGQMTTDPRSHARGTEMGRGIRHLRADPRAVQSPHDHRPSGPRRRHVMSCPHVRGLAPVPPATAVVGWWLLAKAFANGCTAMTGGPDGSSTRAELSFSPPSRPSC